MSNPTPTSPEPVRDELDQEGLERAAQENYRERIKQQFGQDPGGMIGTRIGCTIPWDQLGEKFKQQEREATRAAILAYRERERQWRPIETAPKDGTKIDLWHREWGRQPDCYFGKPEHSCGENEGYCDSDWHWLKDGWVEDGLNESLWCAGDDITHWMPLPKAPDHA